MSTGVKVVGVCVTASTKENWFNYSIDDLEGFRGLMPVVYILSFLKEIYYDKREHLYVWNKPTLKFIKHFYNLTIRKK